MTQGVGTKSALSRQATAQVGSGTATTGARVQPRSGAVAFLRGGGWVLVATAVLAAPWVLSSQYDLNVLVTLAINAIQATGLAVVVRAGRLSLAQATFGGIGGYVSGILVMHYDVNYWPALLAAGIVAASFGILLGLTSLKLQGFYFAIATFTFSQIAIIILSAWRSVTGGLSGMFGLPVPPAIGLFDFDDPVFYYYFSVLVLLVALGIAWLCSSGTRFGRGLTVLGEDEVLAGAMGVPATPYRLAAFAISSFVGGIAGSLGTHFIQGISPTDIAPAVSVFIVVMVMAGGVQMLLGPVIGAAILTAVPELLRVSAQWSMVLYGAFLLAYVFFFRRGLLPLLDSFVMRLLPVRWVTIPAAAAQRPVSLPLSATLAQVAHASDVALAFEDVACLFGDTRVLQEVSFKVRRGELRGIIGPNGAGKTTLFNVITGNAPLSAGRVLLDGHAIRPSPARMARRGVARTFQHPRVLTTRTVVESIRLGAELVGSRPTADYLDWVAEMTALRPLLDVPGSLLSHFERRRLTIAMAISGRPRILLLGEPLAGLDDRETHLLKDCIHDIHRQLGCTLLLIEHKLGVVMQICSQLTVLDYGQVIAEGDPEAVSRNDAVIQAYLGS